MTTTAHTTDTLSTLDIKELRKIFTAITKLGPGTRKPATLIKAIINAQADAAPGSDTEGDEPEPEVVDTNTEGTDDGNQEPEPELVVGTDPQGTDDASQEAEVVDDGATVDNDDQEATEPEVTADQEPTTEPEPQHPAPAKVRVVGTGSMEGSTLVCDLLSLSSLIAEVQVMTDRIRFRVDDGEPVRTKKAWGSGGWRLDVSTLPEVPEPTIEDAAVSASALSVRQLQEIYEKVVQRPTKSSNRGYLAWRIREASKGRLPTSTRRSRSGEPTRVVPVAMAVSTVEALDAAWKRNGFSTRIAFIRDALSEKLVGLGEDEVAEMIGR